MKRTLAEYLDFIHTNSVFGSVDPNRPVNAFTYRLVVIFAAMFMLTMAFHFAIGPIYTGEDSQNGSLLQVHD
jgi:hypothetical protein